MFRSIESIRNFSKLEKMLFDDRILEKSDKDRNDFFTLLKALSESELDDILKTLTEPADLTKYRKEIKDAPAVSDKEQKEIDIRFVQIADEIRRKRMEMEKNTLRIKEKVLVYREMIKAEFNHFETSLTDQILGIEVPLAQKTVETGAEVISLPEVNRGIFSETDIYNCLNSRKSHRKYKDEPITIDELSFLLWATQGLKRKSPDNRFSTRTVPSGGSRQPFETYLAVHDVTGLKPGIYRYLPFGHQLVFLFAVDDLKQRVSSAAHDQKFAGNCAVTFIWSAVPYRTEWRYTLASAKIILQDSGHLCQNLYLACEAIGCGTCAIGAYDQQLFDGLLKLDGTDEFTIYAAPVGKVDKQAPVVKMSPEEMMKYCGTYLCKLNDLKRTIRVKDGILLYCRGNGMDSVLECTGPHRFVMADGNAVLTFSQDLKERGFRFQAEEGEILEFRIQDTV